MGAGRTSRPSEPWTVPHLWLRVCLEGLPCRHGCGPAHLLQALIVCSLSSFSFLGSPALVSPHCCEASLGVPFQAVPWTLLLPAAPCTRDPDALPPGPCCGSLGAPLLGSARTLSLRRPGRWEPPPLGLLCEKHWVVGAVGPLGQALVSKNWTPGSEGQWAGLG